VAVKAFFISRCQFMPNTHWRPPFPIIHAKKYLFPWLIRHSLTDSSQYQRQLQHNPQPPLLPTHCCGHTNKVANGVTELCGLWSKNIHSTWYQQFKGFAARKGVVVPGFPHVSKTRYLSYDNMAHIILRNSSLIGDFLNKYSGSEVFSTSCEVLVHLGDPYVLQVMSIMSQSLE